MRILLTNSPFQYYMTTAFFHPDWGALNLAQLAAMVRDQHEVVLVDNWHSLVRQESVISTVKSLRPDVVGVSNSTAGDTNRVLSLVEDIRRVDGSILILAGGQAATMHATQSLAAGVDVVIRDEGEFAFREVIERFSSGSRDFSGIGGITFRKEGELHSTERRPMIQHLDDLPLPAWDLMPRLKSKFFPNTYASVVESSRGCPFHCNFCAVQSFWQRSYRKKSNARIVEEVEYLTRRMGCEQVYFIDDSFALNVREYTELFEMMLQRGLRVRGFSQIRPDTVANNPEMIRLAARVGFWGFLVGFDSYDDQELKSVSKTGGKEINDRAARILRENGIGIFGVHMFGMPGARSGSFATTFRYGMGNSDTFRMSRFSLIPGTPLFNELSAEGKVEERADRYVPYSHKVKMSPAQLRQYNLLYIWYEFRSLLGFGALVSFLRSRGIARILKWRAYIVAVRYVAYLVLRKIGLPTL